MVLGLKGPLEQPSHGVRLSDFGRLRVQGARMKILCLNLTSLNPSPSR